MFLVIVTVVVSLLTAAVCMGLVVLGLEAIAACLAKPAMENRDSVRRPRLAVLIPAHNEERGLPHTLAGVIAELAPGDRCVVVADNCDDGTAAAAASFEGQ